MIVDSPMIYAAPVSEDQIFLSIAGHQFEVSRAEAKRICEELDREIEFATFNDEADTAPPA